MKIGILQTGHAPEELKSLGTYPEMFARLLDGHDFTFETWVVVDGDFPPGPEAADGWLITGSRHGVYEDHDWMAPLMAFIRAVYAADRPMVGVCFGHQAMAQALGGAVEKFSGGWAIGPQRYRYEDQDRVVQAWHQDQVIRVPEGAKVVAGNDFCQNAALLYPGKGYSVQPHPEFDADFIIGLIQHRGKGLIPDDMLAQASDNVGAPLDSADIGAQFARFFKERRIA